MDQREVEGMIKALQKAVAGKEPSANIITILEKLKKDVAATEDLLRVCFFEGRIRPLIKNITDPCTGYKGGNGSRKAKRP
jgi:hypothetical protein